MNHPSTAAVHAAVFALPLVALSSQVAAGRVGTEARHGDDSNSRLWKRMRAQVDLPRYLS